jgi:hypothetical protein
MPHGDALVAVATVLLFAVTLALVYANISMGRIMNPPFSVMASVTGRVADAP